MGSTGLRGGGGAQAYPGGGSRPPPPRSRWKEARVRGLQSGGPSSEGHKVIFLKQGWEWGGLWVRGLKGDGEQSGSGRRSGCENVQDHPEPFP